MNKRNRVSNIRMIDRLGRICIPKDIRTMLNVKEDTKFTVEYDIDAQEIRIVPLSKELCSKLNLDD